MSRFTQKCPALPSDVPFYPEMSRFMDPRPALSKNVPLSGRRSPFTQDCPLFSKKGSGEANQLFDRRLKDQVKAKRATTVPSGERPTVSIRAVAGSPVRTVSATASKACGPSSQVKVVSPCAFFSKLA